MEAVKSADTISSRSPDTLQSGRRPHLFSAKSHAPIWRAMRAALVRSEGVILVIGEEGSGKTSLIKRLHGMLPDNRDLVLLQASDLSYTEFLQQLITVTSLARSGDAGSLSPVEPEADADSSYNMTLAMPVMTVQDLVDALEERVVRGRKLVLAVDQAHLLNGEQLTLLDLMVRFVSHEVKPVQLLLAGRPEMRARMESEEWKNLVAQVVGSCEVTPLTRGEVWDYLAFKLDKSMGWPVRVSWFGWVEIYSYSQGIPKKIDLLLKRILPLVKQRNARVVTRSMVRIAMTMGRPMRQGSFLGAIPRTRLAAGVGGAVLLLGVVYLVSGLFGSSSRAPGETVVKTGSGSESSSYVQLFKPEPPPKPVADAPAEDPTDKTTATKKRYWEPSMAKHELPPRPTPSQPEISELTGKKYLNSSRPPQIPDPEAFRRRYQMAKSLKAAPVPLPETPPSPAMDKPLPPETPPKTSDVRETTPSSSNAKPAAHSTANALPQLAVNTIPLPRHVESVDKPVATRPTVKATPSPAPSVHSAPRKEAKPARSANESASQARIPHVSGVATEKSFRSVGKLFVVQIGSYSSLENAEQLKKTLAGKGGDPYVHLFERNQRRWFSVRMNYRNHADAKRMADTIHQQESLPTKVLELNYD